MLDAVQAALSEKYVGTTYDDRICDEIRAEIRRALLDQISVRGLATPEFAKDMAGRFQIEDSRVRSKLVIRISSSWLKAVDEQFRSGTCERCRKFVAVPWNHDVQECDMHVVTEVMET